MLLLILVNVPCLEHFFNFGKSSNSQNYFSSDPHNPMKVSFIAKFAIALTWNGENKTILENLEQQFVIVIKPKPTLSTT